MERDQKVIGEIGSVREGSLICNDITCLMDSILLSQLTFVDKTLRASNGDMSSIRVFNMVCLRMVLEVGRV